MIIIIKLCRSYPQEKVKAWKKSCEVFFTNDFLSCSHSLSRKTVFFRDERFKTIWLILDHCVIFFKKCHIIATISHSFAVTIWVSSAASIWHIECCSEPCHCSSSSQPTICLAKKILILCKSWFWCNVYTDFFKSSKYFWSCCFLNFRQKCLFTF